MTADENYMTAVIPVEEFEAFAAKLEGIGGLEWVQKGSPEEGAAYRTVEIQLKMN